MNEDLSNIEVEIPAATFGEITDTIGEIYGNKDLNKKTKDTMASSAIFTFLKDNETIVSLIDDSKDEFWVYRDGIYIPNGKTLIYKWTHFILGQMYDKRIAENVIDRFNAEMTVDKEFFFDYPIRKPDDIVVKNGILDMKTLDLKPHNPNEIHFSRINAKYDPKKDCPTVKNFLEEVLPDEKSRKLFQEFVGFSLIKEYRFEKAFILHGKHGRNGKTKLLSYLEHFFGDDNVSNLSFNDIQENQFALSELHGKLVNITGEVNEGAVSNQEVFKKLTGQDRIDVNRKFLTNLRFRNYAKLILAANEIPPVYHADDAFWNRWVILEFPNQFLTPTNYDKNNPNHRIQKQNVLQELIEADETDGFLNWAIEGYQRLHRQGGFSSDMKISDIERYWKKNSNSIFAFIEEEIVEDPDDFIMKDEFRKKYHDFCMKKRLRQVGDRAIKTTLSEAYGVSDFRPMIDAEYGIYDRAHAWKGIKFKE